MPFYSTHLPTRQCVKAAFGLGNWTEVFCFVLFLGLTRAYCLSPVSNSAVPATVPILGSPHPV